MAGFIFSIYKEENIEGVKKCIRQGVYASKVPMINFQYRKMKVQVIKVNKLWQRYWQIIVRCRLVIMCIFV